MSESLLDAIGIICMFASFAAPLYIIPIFWKKITGTKTKKFFIGLLISVPVAIVLFITAFFIVFRNGIGFR